MFIMLFGVVGFIISVYYVTEYFEPFFNKFFSKIWKENTIIKPATVERLKELYVDTDKNAEALLLQASIEEDTPRQHILDAFCAVDAKDLAAIVRGDPRNFLVKLGKLNIQKTKRNMYGNR